MASAGYIQFLDYGKEASSFRWIGKSVTSANYDAELVLVDALRTALEAVTLGNRSRQVVKALDNEISSAAAGSAFAQREIKWLVTMVGDSSGDIYRREIPTADLTFLALNGEDMAAGTERTDLVDALEDLFRGDGDETVTVDTIKFVGRST